MGQQAEVEPRAPRQQARGEVERDPVDLGAQQVREAHVAPRHQREGRQEVLAELAVRDPRRAVLVGLERERVDQDRAAGAELDVERRGVAQRPAVGERVELGVERQERGVAQLPERPLVRVADELDRLGRDDARGRRAPGRARGTPLRRAAAVPARSAAASSALPAKRIPFGGEALLDLAVRASVAPEDEPAGVAERAWVTRSAGGRISRRGRRHPRTLGSMSSGSASRLDVDVRRLVAGRAGPAAAGRSGPGRRRPRPRSRRSPPG